MRSLRRTAAAMGGVLLAGTLLVPASVAAPTWVGPVAPLDSSSQPPGPTHVAFGPDGDALAVWTNTTGTTGYIRYADRQVGAAG